MGIQTTNEVSVILFTNYFFNLRFSQHHCQYEIGHDANDEAMTAALLR